MSAVLRFALRADAAVLLSAAAALVWVPSIYWRLFAAGSDDADEADDYDDHVSGRGTDDGDGGGNSGRKALELAGSMLAVALTAVALLLLCTTLPDPNGIGAASVSRPSHRRSRGHGRGPLLPPALPGASESPLHASARACEVLAALKAVQPVVLAAQRCSGAVCGALFAACALADVVALGPPGPSISGDDDGSGGGSSGSYAYSTAELAHLGCCLLLAVLNGGALLASFVCPDRGPSYDGHSNGSDGAQYAQQSSPFYEGGYGGDRPHPSPATRKKQAHGAGAGRVLTDPGLYKEPLLPDGYDGEEDDAEKEEYRKGGIGADENGYDDDADVDPDSNSGNSDNADYPNADDDDDAVGHGGGGRLGDVMGRAEVHSVTGEGFEDMSDSVSVIARQNRLNPSASRLGRLGPPPPLPSSFPPGTSPPHGEGQSGPGQGRRGGRRGGRRKGGAAAAGFECLPECVPECAPDSPPLGATPRRAAGGGGGGGCGGGGGGTGGGNNDDDDQDGPEGKTGWGDLFRLAAPQRLWLCVVAHHPRARGRLPISFVCFTSPPHPCNLNVKCTFAHLYVISYAASATLAARLPFSLAVPHFVSMVLGAVIDGDGAAAR